jgi:hypothetical protein
MSNSDATKDSSESTERTLPRRILIAVGFGILFSFIISEAIFLYLLQPAFEGFPQNLLGVLVFLSISFVLIRKFVSVETALLSFYTSLLALVLIINWFVGDPAYPSILSKYAAGVLTFKGSSDALVGDFLVIGLIGGSIWLGVLEGTLGIMTKLNKISVKEMPDAVHSKIRVIGENAVGRFDKHPWMATIIMGIITLILGLIIGKFLK